MMALLSHSTNLQGGATARRDLPGQRDANRATFFALEYCVCGSRR